MIEELIQEMEAQIDCDSFEAAQERCMEKLEEAASGLEAVEPLLALLERHPMSDFGMPGPIVHYVERFYKQGYEALLIDSVTRRPTLHTVWMMNRIKNANENAELYQKLLENVLTRQDVEEEIKASVKELLA